MVLFFPQQDAHSVQTSHYYFCRGSLCVLFLVRSVCLCVCLFVCLQIYKTRVIYVMIAVLFITRAGGCNQTQVLDKKMEAGHTWNQVNKRQFKSRLTWVHEVDR